MKRRILVVEDDRTLRQALTFNLSREDYEVRVAVDGEQALSEFQKNGADIVVTDMVMPKLGGMEVLRGVNAANPDVPVIIITAHGTVDSAVEAIKLGAFDFIEKPFEAERLLLLVERATETERLRREVVSLRASVGRENDLTGNSAAINTVRATLKRVASTGSRVLITGGPGVGKEVAARLLHGWSQRTTAPFVIVSAARMLPERVEEELFGVEEGGDLVRPGLAQVSDRRADRLVVGIGGECLLLHDGPNVGRPGMGSDPVLTSGPTHPGVIPAKAGTQFPAPSALRVGPRLSPG